MPNVKVPSYFVTSVGISYANLQSASVSYEAYNKVVGLMLRRDSGLLAVLQNVMDNDPTILALQEGASRVVQPDGGQGGAFGGEIQVNALAFQRAGLAGTLWTALGDVVAGLKIAHDNENRFRYKAGARLMVEKLDWKIGGENVLDILNGLMGPQKRYEAFMGLYGTPLNEAAGIVDMGGDQTSLAYNYYVKIYNAYQLLPTDKKWK